MATQSAIFEGIERKYETLQSEIFDLQNKLPNSLDNNQILQVKIDSLLKAGEQIAGQLEQTKRKVTKLKEAKHKADRELDQSVCQC